MTTTTIRNESGEIRITGAGVFIAKTVLRSVWLARRSDDYGERAARKYARSCGVTQATHDVIAQGDRTVTMHEALEIERLVGNIRRNHKKEIEA